MNCRDGKGERCPKEADFSLCAPDGTRNLGYMCKEHAARVINEYRDKLGQEWYAFRVDENGDAIPLTPIFRG